ncbi:MAG TPA: alpha/beta hydrolase [Bacteriovoracaceae bacterium]|nr:alpha/beta hydrolase [Bacteriovoracaceae bacterium]
MPFINVGQENSTEIELYYEDHGQGDPMVLIHGYPFSGLAWEKQVSYFLEKGFRVITYDRRGFGQSSKTATGYDYDTFAKDLDAIMTELDLGDVTLVGHSMGTGEVTRYISQYGSERVKCGVLISPIPPFLLNGVDKEVFRGFKAAIVKDRYEFITEFLNNFYNLGKLNFSVSDEKLRADFILASSSSPIAFYKCVDTWTTDFRDDLTHIDIPMLVIHGDKDKILPFDYTAKLLPDLIDADLRVIKGGSHGIPWTHADEISRMILEFISQEAGSISDFGEDAAQIQ